LVSKSKIPPQLGGALLQILDSEQNPEFLDHYLGVTRG